MYNPARPSTSAHLKALKTACQIVVNILGGGREASKLTVVDPSTISLYHAAHEDERFMRIDVALDLDLAAGEPHITRTLAAAQGFVLVRESDFGRPDPAGPLNITDLAALQREAAEAKLSVIGMLGRDGGDLTDACRRSVLKELADLRQAVASIEAKIGGTQ